MIHVSIREALISETAYKDDILEIYEIHVCKEDTVLYISRAGVFTAVRFMYKQDCFLVLKWPLIFAGTWKHVGSCIRSRKMTRRFYVTFHR